MRLDKGVVARIVDADYGQTMLIASDRAQAGNPEEEQIWQLLLKEVHPDPNQPRRHFNEESLRALADDIVLRGVLQPIIVRPDENGYIIIVGERRWRASQIAGKNRIPCIVRKFSALEVRQAQLVENVLREDISDIERGISLRRLYEQMKSENPHITWENVAKLVGITRMRIHHLYSLSELPEEIVQMIQDRRISGSHGVELTKICSNRELTIQLAMEASRNETGQGPYGL